MIDFKTIKAKVHECGYRPEILLPALDYCIHQAKLSELNAYGFKASFNPSHPGNPAILMAGGSHRGITGSIRAEHLDDRKLSQ